MTNETIEEWPDKDAELMAIHTALASAREENTELKEERELIIQRAENAEHNYSECEEENLELKEIIKDCKLENEVDERNNNSLQDELQKASDRIDELTENQNNKLNIAKSRAKAVKSLCLASNALAGESAKLKDMLKTAMTIIDKETQYIDYGNFKYAVNKLMLENEEIK